MDEQTARDISRQITRDATPLPVQVPIRDAWLMVLALQVCTRDPDFSVRTRTVITRVAMHFQDAIVERHPEAEAVLEWSWDHVQAEGDQPNKG